MFAPWFVSTRFVSVVLALVLIMSRTAFAELELSHELNTQLSVSTKDLTELKSMNNQLLSHIDYSTSKFKLTGIVQFEHEIVNNMQANFANNKSYSDFSRPLRISNHSQVAIRELYVSMPLSSHYLSIGKQQVVWGKADGVKILDVVNPQSFNEFILADFEQSRVPLWLVNLELSLADDILQLLWIPDTSTHQLPVTHSAFNFTSPRFVPQMPSGIDLVLLPNRAPSIRLKNSDFGMRWTSFIKGWDIALNYLYHYEDLPFFEAMLDTDNMATVVVSPLYYRSNLYGASFSKPFGNFTFRGEVAYETNQHHYKKDRTKLLSGELNYVIGLDYFGLEDILISGQIIQSSLLDADNADLFRPKSDTSVSLLLRRHFWQETLEAEVLWQQNVNQNDGLIRPQINYAYSDGITFSLGADIFYGAHEGLYGQFDEQDRLVFSTSVTL